MWVCRYGAGSLYVHIEDGWWWRSDAGGGERGARGYMSPPLPHRNGRDHSSPSDDKNAIIMAPE